MTSFSAAPTQGHARDPESRAQGARSPGWPPSLLIEARPCAAHISDTFPETKVLVACPILAKKALAAYRRRMSGEGSFAWRCTVRKADAALVRGVVERLPIRPRARSPCDPARAVSPPVRRGAQSFAAGGGAPGGHRADRAPDGARDVDCELPDRHHVISEVRKGDKCDRQVASWDASIDDADIYSASGLGEIRRGAEHVRGGDRAVARARSVAVAEVVKTFAAAYPCRSGGGRHVGRMSAGRTVPAVDALMAATAKVYGMTLATRTSHMSLILVRHSQSVRERLRPTLRADEVRSASPPTHRQRARRGVFDQQLVQTLGALSEKPTDRHEAAQSRRGQG